MSAKTDGARSNPTYNAQVQKYSILKVTPPGIISLMHFEGFLDEKLSCQRIKQNIANPIAARTRKTLGMILLPLGKCALLSIDGGAFR